MDIISSLATLSYDKRRRDFFSSQLLTLLELIDNKLVDSDNLYGSWAGAYGNFQFMPTTIKRYAIDYDGNNKIDLKYSLEDSIASAANYINRIGWKKGQPCFYQVKLTKLTRISSTDFIFAASRIPILPCFPNSFGNANTLASVQVRAYTGKCISIGQHWQVY